jgi:transposase
MEIFTNVSGRRMWPASLKAKIVAESLADGAKVSEVARRHGARPSQVHEWRKHVREGRLALPADCGALNFAPVVIAEPNRPPARRAPSTEMSAIEIEACGVVVRIRGAADAAMVAAIVRALRA